MFRAQFFYHSASIFFHNVLQPTYKPPVEQETKPESESEAEQDVSTASSKLDQLHLEAGKGTEHGPGETNVPWQRSWVSQSPTSADFDEMVWAPPRGGEGSEQSFSMTADENWEDLWRTSDQESGAGQATSGNAWHNLFPDSMAAEQSMIQAALEASLREAAQSSGASTERDANRPDSPDTMHSPSELFQSSSLPVRSEKDMIASQVDLLHQELAGGLPRELPSEKKEPTGSLLD